MRIGYARVSTDDQCLDLQIDALRKDGCEEIFEDHGVSAVAEIRPGLVQALDHLNAGDVLVTWRLDRLARSLHNLMDITTSLTVREIGLVSLCEHIDTASAAGRLILHVFGAVAEFERSLIVERTRAGMAAAKAKGVKFGRKSVVTPELIMDAALLLHRGRSITDTARELNIARTTLYRHLAQIHSATV